MCAAISTSSTNNVGGAAFHSEQELLRRTNRLLSFDTTWAHRKTKALGGTHRAASPHKPKNLGGKRRQQGDPISRLVYFENKESRLENVI
jgi:hypothetical protein